MIYYGIFGTGGMGREAMDIALFQSQSFNHGEEVKCVFVVDEKREFVCNGVPVMSFHDFVNSSEKKYINIAVGDGIERKKISERCHAAGLNPLTLIALTSVVYGSSQPMGEGCFIGHYASITSNCRIGRGLILNTGARIAHDAIIGDFVTISPGALINGWVEIGDGAFIGSGAIIRNGNPEKRLVIGKGEFIPMGERVTVDRPGQALVHEQFPGV